MKLHLIDTDVFIRANREHYGLDYCPAFWDWLAFHGQADNVGSVVAVLEEIRYPIELKQWARGPGRQLLRAADTDVLAAARDVSLWVHGAGYLAGAVTSFMSKADYWIVSHALAHGCAVVTRGGSADRQEGQDSECMSRPWRPVRGSMDDVEDDRGAVHSGSRGKHRAKPDMNLHVLESQVRGLRRTADDLLTEFDRAIEPSARPLSADEEDRFVAAVLVMPILRALAAELSLKAISFKRSGRFRKTHDLRTLYQELDQDTRNRIEQRAAARRINAVRDTLKKHRADFVDWRCAGEGKALNTNPSDLDEAVEILMAVYEETETVATPGN